MDEKPAVQPVLQTHLEIEHAPLVAPVLNLFDPAAVRFRHPQFDEAKGVVGETRIVQTHPVAAPGTEIGKNLAIDEFDQYGFRCRIGR